MIDENENRLIKMYNQPKDDTPPQAVWFARSQILRVENVVGLSSRCHVYLANRNMPLICFGSADEVVRQIRMGGRK